MNQMKWNHLFCRSAGQSCLCHQHFWYLHWDLSSVTKWEQIIQTMCCGSRVTAPCPRAEPELPWTMRCCHVSTDPSTANDDFGVATPKRWNTLKVRRNSKHQFVSAKTFSWAVQLGKRFTSLGSVRHVYVSNLSSSVNLHLKELVNKTGFLI